MQERFSITENWDSASSNKAVIWAISHVITNIHKHVKSEERQPKCETGWGKALKRVDFFKALFDRGLCLSIMCMEMLMVKNTKTLHSDLW